MLLNMSYVSFLGLSGLLVLTMLLVHNGVVRDIYGQLHPTTQILHGRGNNRKWHSIFILFTYGILSGYPFFMGTSISHAYYTSLDLIVFSTASVLLFVTHIQPNHKNFEGGLISFSRNILTRMSGTVIGFLTLGSLILYFLSVDIFYIIVPVSIITPIVVYLWIRDTYSFYEHDTIIIKHILSCVYLGIVVAALLGAHVRSIYDTV